MNALLKLLPKPTEDSVMRLAVETFVSLGVDRATITTNPEGFELHIGDERIWLGNLLSICRTLWPWQRRSAARQFLGTFLNKPKRPDT